MKKLAADHDVWLTFGMKETIEDPADHRCYNTVVMVNNKGEIVQTYRKTHLYDAFGYKESNEYKAGDKFFEPVVLRLENSVYLSATKFVSRK